MVGRQKKATQFHVRYLEGIYERSNTRWGQVGWTVLCDAMTEDLSKRWNRDLKLLVSEQMFLQVQSMLLHYLKLLVLEQMSTDNI